MIISNSHLNNVSVNIQALPPQHQNLAPPTQNKANGDSVVLSSDTLSCQQNQQFSPWSTNSMAKFALNEQQNTNSQVQSTAANNSEEFVNNISSQQQSNTDKNCSLVAQQEKHSQNNSTIYSTATSTSCAFSSESAPALLFQENFSAGWQLDESGVQLSQSQLEEPATPAKIDIVTSTAISSTLASTENTEVLSSTEKAEAAAEPANASATIKNNNIMTEATSSGKTKAAEGSSSTRSKAETKKAPASEGPPSQAEEQALKEEKEQQEKQRVEVIYERIRAEKLLHEAKRQAIWADLQTELRRIWRDVMLRRKKSEDDYQKNWQKVFLNAG